MQARSIEAGFLKSRPARILSVFLLMQAAVLYGVSRKEIAPGHTPLKSVPASFGPWIQIGETEIDQETQAVLKADDLLNRTYANPGIDAAASLFVAFFKSQRSGQAPHSPKNCLPGAGWVPSSSDIVHIDVPGRSEPLEANRYVVARGDARSLVLYWYQSRDRTVASEYTAKFYVVADAIRYNRTDTALVRVVIPMGNMDMAAAETAATNFVRSFYAPLRQHFPIA